MHHLCYVTDLASWVVDREANSITRWIQDQYGLPCQVIADPSRAVSDIVHFGCQHLFTGGGYRGVGAFNRMVLTCYHGDRDDPAFAKPVEILLREQRRLDRVIVSCRTMRDRMMEWGMPAHKVCMIPIGVDLDVFRPAVMDERETCRARLGIGPRQVAIGSFQKDGVGWGDGHEPKLVKGPDVFLRVIERLKDSLPLCVLLTGPARGYVRAGLDAMKVPYRHIPVESYEDMVSCYQALDLYLVASREEGGPKAVMESMATGIPLVATRVGMAADYIRNGVNGFLCDVEDDELLATRATEVLGNAALRDQITAHGLETAKRCDYRQVARMHYEQVYLPLLQKWWV